MTLNFDTICCRNNLQYKISRCKIFIITRRINISVQNITSWNRRYLFNAINVSSRLVWNTSDSVVRPTRTKFTRTKSGNWRQISRPRRLLRAFSVERSRISAVGGRDPKVGSEVGERERDPGGGTGGYCLLGDLSSNTSRQAASPGHRQRGEPVGF